jgi:hypothetical protein
VSCGGERLGVGLGRVRTGRRSARGGDEGKRGLLRLASEFVVEEEQGRRAPEREVSGVGSSVGWLASLARREEG